MKSTIKKTVTITLQLNEVESDWLRELVRNPIVEFETNLDSQMREKFFEALTKPAPGGPME